MRRNSRLSALAAVSLLCVLILAACCSNTPVLRYLTVTPTTATINAGTTQQFTATAFYANGSSTSGASVLWTSSNPAVATITTGGVATGVGFGTTTITASAGTASATATLNVNQLLSIVVAPANQTIGLTGTEQFTATGTYKNSSGTTSTVDVSSLATWTSGTPAVATINSTGLATAVAGGTTLITAALDGVTGSTNLTVSGAPVPVSLQITPSAPTAAVGNAVSFVATEVWSDSSLHTPSGTVTWTSGTPATATVVAGTPTSNALSAALAAGTTTITATEGTLTAGTATLTVVAGTAHFAYVSNTADLTIQWYTVSATASPYLTSGGTAGVGGSPVQAFLHPSGQYLYVISDTSAVYVYNVNSSTGAPTLSTITQPQAIATTSTTGTGNYGTIDPYGRFLYVTDSSGGTAGNIWGYRISPTDGSLTAITGSPFTANVNAPQIAIIDHSGSYLYAVNAGSAPGTISAYTIDQTSGALAALTSTPFLPTGNSPLYAALDPSGTHIYVANSASTDNSVSGYTIGTGGALTAIGTTATPITGAYEVFNVAVDPSGKYLYVLDTGDTVSILGKVYSYNIGTGGAIGSAIGTPAATGLGPIGISVDPTGKLIAVDNNFDSPGDITPISIGSGGVLTSDTAVPAGSQPIFVIFYNAP